MITISFIYDALKGSFKFIWWLFRGMIMLTVKAVAILFVLVWTTIIVAVGWIIKEITKYALNKAGVDTSGWKCPVDLNTVEAGLDRWNRKIDRHFWKLEHPYKRVPYSVDEMIFYDLMDND